MIKEKADLEEKTDFNPIRKKNPTFSEASRSQQASLIKENLHMA